MNQNNLIIVKLDRGDFEYDIHSLVKAFYPQCEVKVSADELPAGAMLRIFILLPANGKISARICKGDADTGISENDGDSCEAAGSNDNNLSCRGCWYEDDSMCILSEEAAYDESLSRPEIKSVLKRLIYRMLREVTGRDLPWGDLTGIRPTKIPMALLEKGWRNIDIAKYLRSEYYVSPAKGALAISIANREKHILDELHPQGGYSLYVGIPFCPSICLYCSFSSGPMSVWKDKAEEYLQDLFKEIEAASSMLPDHRLQTIYIGGGTPTTLTAGQLERLILQIKRHFDLTHLKEWTVEAGRPDSTTRQQLQVLREQGIDRISINPQSMNQQTLDLIGRSHRVEDIEEKFLLARELGFENINMDLIVGLPGEGPDEVMRTMERVNALDPDSVTVHSLALKRGTRLHLMMEQYQDISFRTSTQIMDLTQSMNAEKGRMPYYLYRQKNMAGNFENVGYARAGKECLYNILIMEEVQSILAVGAGASTKLVHKSGLIERVENVKDIKSYLERIDEMIDRKRIKLEGYHG